MNWFSDGAVSILEWVDSPGWVRKVGYGETGSPAFVESLLASVYRTYYSSCLFDDLIGFGSLVLDSAQRNYCTTRKELLAVVRFTRHFKHCLFGQHFTLRTDHNSLIWLMGYKDIEGQLARWIEELTVYNMEIVHRHGKDHVNADGLWRIPDLLVQCNYYSYGCDVQDLPCGGCKYCVRANEQWDMFYNEVDDIVPLAVMQISH